jgi:hypothetical protein
MIQISLYHRGVCMIGIGYKLQSRLLIPIEASLIKDNNFKSNIVRTIFEYSHPHGLAALRTHLSLAPSFLISFN